MKILLLSVLIIIIIISYILYSNSQIVQNIVPNDFYQCQYNNLIACQTPILNQSQCYSSEYYKCPHINGSYKQCTNNYWSYDKVCDCHNSNHLCIKPYQVDAKCFQEKMKNCSMPKINDFEIITNPRVNLYYADKSNNYIKNDNVLY